MKSKLKSRGEIASGPVWRRSWSVYHSSTYHMSSNNSYTTSFSLTIQLLTIQKQDSWNYGKIIESFFLNAFPCHSIETLMNLVTIAGARDMCNSHATLCTIHQHPCKKYWLCHWKEKGFCYQLWYFYFLSNFQWIWLSGFQTHLSELLWAGLKKEGIVHITKSGSYEKGNSIYCDCRIRAWILRNLCSNHSHFPTVWP